MRTAGIDSAGIGRIVSSATFKKNTLAPLPPHRQTGPIGPKSRCENKISFAGFGRLPIMNGTFIMKRPRRRNPVAVALYVNAALLLAVLAVLLARGDAPAL